MKKTITREYKIKSKGNVITVVSTNGETIAQYRGISAQSLRRVLDAHIANGGTLGNYQW
jgi:hypothetical protein